MPALSDETPALAGGTLVIASHNAGKVREIRELLAPFGLETPSAADLGLAEPEETGATFRENAAIKSRATARAAACPALADDSGLVVSALGGQPGVESARWAGAERDFGRAMARLNHALGREPDRRASFVCALALAWPDGRIACFEGRVDGSLVWPPRGNRGFGYDPMFLPDGFALTFGEMDPAAKHGISHRARAFRLLAGRCLAGAGRRAGARA
ncbi:MAG: RdgB/HAM1 family non-canonical purine NTP pyrophosphatase [Alphaproteobacteria bacterium]